MAELNSSQVFGNSVDWNTSTKYISFNLQDFGDVGDGNNGSIEGGIGLSVANQTTFINDPDSHAVAIFYALLLLIRQNQAANINEDPTQSIFITENPVRLASGSRTGQIQRSSTINFFSDGNITQLADIDDI